MVTISPTISTISINGHDYTHADWEANTPGVIGALGNDISDQIAALALVGTLTKAISGNTTLTGPESTNLGFIFTGTLSAQATITFAAGFSGIAQIENHTTGGFSLLCGLAAGNKVTIPVSGGATIFCDGTNFVLADGISRGSAGPGIIGDLNITGSGTFSGTLDVTGNINAGADINVTGSIFGVDELLTGNLTVNGATELIGNTIIQGTATINQNCYVALDGTYGGDLSVVGNFVVQTDATFGGQFSIQGAGEVRSKINTTSLSGPEWLEFDTSELTRWVVGKSGEAEAGSNTGSNFQIGRYADAGTNLGVPFIILRNSGYILMQELPASSSGLPTGALWNNSGVVNVV